MADEKQSKLTIYQQLNKFLNIGGFGANTDSTPALQQSVASAPAKEDRIIIKGNSPEEIHRKGLELEQKKELQNKFFRTTDRGFQKALQYEAARLPAYIDYEGMEYYPIISSALDLFMEEATTIGINGKMLNVYSNKERIKTLLEEFFYEIVNVNVNLPFWVRNTPIKYDSMIPLLNGETITIKELSEKLKRNPNEEIWTYSVQDNTKKIIPGKIIWCDLTRKNSDILKVTFDDGTYVETTPDHEYMLRNGSYCRADELNEGVSLMPFYTKLSDKTKDGIGGYEKVYNPASDYYKYTHRLVAEELICNLNEESQINERFCTHHIDFNKRNNSPENLERMTLSKHFQYHANHANIILQRDDVKKNRMLGIDKYLRSDKRKKRLSVEMFGIYPKYFNEYNSSSLHDDHNIIRKNRMLELWSDKEYQNKVKDKMQLKLDDNCLNYIIDIIKSNNYLSTQNLGQILVNDNDFMILFKKANPIIRKNLNKSLNGRTLREMLFRKTNLKYCDFFLKYNNNIVTETNYKRAKGITYSEKKKNYVEEEIYLNHKVLSVEKIPEKYDVYCMEVVGENNEQDRHNFPVCSKNEKGEYSRNGVFLSNCKYGDNFVLLYGERKKGITHVKQLVNYEIERYERIQNGKPFVKFKERMTGDEFNVFEIAHFRLLGDDRFLPYGNSLLNKIRRVFRQLIMAEDAMLTYRIVRAGEKKVFKIDVGNIDEDDIENYIYKVATKFKKTSQVSPNDGQIDYRFNILGNDEDYFLPVRNANTQTGIDTLPGACLALDTKIELLDGRSLELNEIINEFNSGKELWSYSINPQTGQIVPGKITWAGITRKNTEVLKITLDNGETIICTPDHKFPTKFNGKKEAKDLLVGESMWAFNKKFEKIRSNLKDSKYAKDYEMIYDHSINDWIYTHRVVKNYMENKGLINDFVFDEKHVNDNKTVIHHKSLNRYDNTPNNLVSMSYVDHFKYHSYLGIKNMSKIDMNERVKKLNEGFFNYYNNLTEEEKFNRNTNISNKRKEKLKSLSKEEYLKYIEDGTKRINSEKSRNKLRIIMKSDEYREKMRINGINIRNNSEINARIKAAQSFTYNDNLLNYIINYIKLNNCTLESFVDHINTDSNEFKNIFITLNKDKPYFKSFTKFSRKNILKLIRYYKYNNWSDFKEKIPCYNHKIVSIEWLNEKQDTGTITIDGQEELHNYHNFALSCGIFTQNSNLDAIQDIEYLRDNLFTGIGIPKPFLSFQDAAGGGKNMAQYDIRFSKKISRIQQAMIQELNKMAMIHLYLLGYTGDDLKDFTLTLTNPSTQQELLKAELLREKAQTYTELTRAESGIAAMSHTTAKRMLFNLSDKEIVDDLKQQKMEKVIMQELQDSPVVIKKSGLFADIDKRYGEPIEGMPLGQVAGGPETAPQLGGPRVGGPTGGSAEAGGTPAPIPGLPNQTPAELPPVEGEGIRGRNVLTEEEYGIQVEKLVYGSSIQPERRKEAKHKKIIQENNIINNSLNTTALNMINEIDSLLKESMTINKVYKNTDVQDVDINDIENLEV